MVFHMFSTKPKNDEIVITLHGLGNTSLHMWRMARACRQSGYDTANWTYNTLRGGIADQMARLARRLPELQGYKKVHGIGHSLGGLMLRGLFTRYAGQLPLGRLVMIGSPNQGASILRRQPWLIRASFIGRPILTDLTQGSAAIAALGLPPVEVGVIAGVSANNPVNPISWINRYMLGDVPSDGTVEAAHTHLPGMKDYLELPVNHVALPWNREVIDSSLRFIKTGAFR